jgi:hypothetical protein
LASICVPCSCMRSATWDLSSNTRSGFCCRMSMIWLEERLNDGVKLGAFVELLESAFLLSLPAVVVEALPPVVVAGALLSPPGVGCVVLCVGAGENGVCPCAGAAPAHKNATTNAARKNVSCGTRVPSVPTREERLGVTLSASAKVEDCDMSISFYNLKLRNLTHRRVMGWSVNCHSFVDRGKSWAIIRGQG